MKPGPPTTPRMQHALRLVKNGVNRYRAAKAAGVAPSSLYAKLAKIRREGGRDSCPAPDPQQ